MAGGCQSDTRQWVGQFCTAIMTKSFMLSGIRNSCFVKCELGTIAERN